MSVGLGVRRNAGETWRQAAIRIAKAHGVEREVAQAYRDARKSGVSEEEAAWHACYEWDVAEIIEDDE